MQAANYSSDLPSRVAETQAKNSILAGHGSPLYVAKTILDVLDLLFKFLYGFSSIISEVYFQYMELIVQLLSEG